MNSDGSEAASWLLASGETLQLSGNPGGDVSVDQSSISTDPDVTGDFTVCYSPALLDKSDPQGALDAYQKPGRSVVNDATAVGIPADEIASTYSQLATPDPYPGSTEVTATPNTILGSWCISLTRPGGAAVGWAHSCYTRTLTVAYSNGDWYWADKYLASGAYPGNKSLTKLRTHSNYVTSLGDDIIDWSPASTRTVGSCKDQTTSISVVGYTYSSKTTVCPDRMDPYTTDGINNTFGAQWSGNDHDDYVESVNSVTFSQ